jgi:hypothetical protein
MSTSQNPIRRANSRTLKQLPETAICEEQAYHKRKWAAKLPCAARPECCPLA